MLLNGIQFLRSCFTFINLLCISLISIACRHSTNFPWKVTKDVMQDLHNLIKAIQITAKLDPGVKLDDESKFYRKIKANFIDTIMDAVNNTGLFNKHLPNRDRVLGNVIDQGKVTSNKDYVVRVLAKAFLDAVFNGLLYLNDVALPGENGNLAFK